MPKYGGEQNFSLGSFPEEGEKQETWEKEKEKTKGGKVSENNGQLRFRPPPPVAQASLDQKTCTNISLYVVFW